MKGFRGIWHTGGNAQRAATAVADGSAAWACRCGWRGPVRGSRKQAEYDGAIHLRYARDPERHGPPAEVTP